MYNTTTEKARFTRAIVATADLLKGQLSEYSIEAWEHHLSAYPIGVVEAACHEAQRTLTFFPVPSEMLEICHQIQARKEAMERRAISNIDSLLPSPVPAEGPRLLPGATIPMPDTLRDLLAKNSSPAQSQGPRRGSGMLRLVEPPETDPVKHRERVLEQARELREGDAP